MIFFYIEKSRRRFQVCLARTTSHTACHTLQSLEVLCETDSPQMVPWLLAGLDEQRGGYFARQLLEAAALAGEGEVILAKNVPPALYCNSGTMPAVRLLWDALKATINGFSLASSWQWSDADRDAAAAIETAFAAFLAAREDRH